MEAESICLGINSGICLHISLFSPNFADGTLYLNTKGGTKYMKLMVQSQYSQAIDIFRGILITLVILGHCIYWNNAENIYVWRLIYSFHMPAFFLISGYLCYKPVITVSKIPLRFLRLMIPFIIWSCMEAIQEPNFGDTLFLLCKSPDVKFWFLPCLFYISTLFIVLVFLSDRYSLRMEIVSIVASVLLYGCMKFAGVRSWGFDLVTYYFPYYVMGFFCHKYEVRCHWQIAFFCFFVWVVGAFFWSKSVVPLPFAIFQLSSWLLIYVYNLFIALSGSYFAAYCSFWGVTYLHEETLILKGFVFLGKHSLGMYVVHIFLGELLNLYIWPNIGVGNIVSVHFVGLTVLSTFAVWGILHSRILSCILLGEWKMRKI